MRPVLDGVDSVHWDDPAVAGWLDRLTDAGEDDEDEIDDHLPASLLYSGALGPDAATAVPFLLRLSALNPDYRTYLAVRVERMVSPDFDTPGMSAQVRAAVADELEPVIGWADDDDATMRTCAYLILGQCRGPAALLRRRWAVEVDWYARLALLLALGARDPDAADTVLRPALHAGAPSERLAAALALHRAGRYRSPRYSDSSRSGQ
jgi:hypothetical protein